MEDCMAIEITTKQLHDLVQTQHCVYLALCRGVGRVNIVGGHHHHLCLGYLITVSEILKLSKLCKLIR